MLSAASGPQPRTGCRNGVRPARPVGPGRLKDGSRTAEELAATVGVAAGPLYRVLRALTGIGVFAREADGRFRLNPLAEPLLATGRHRPTDYRD